MSDENAPVEGADDQTAEKDEQRVPYERFQQANAKAKDLEKQLSSMKTLMQEREEAELPELERERKRAESLEKRIQDAEKRAEAAEQSVQTSRREQWVAQAAASLDFVNPARVARMIDDLGSIEDAVSAERAVKRLAKSDPYLVKAPDAPIPGRVLENGQPATTNAGTPVDDKAGLAAELYEGLFGGRR